MSVKTEKVSVKAGVRNIGKQKLTEQGETKGETKMEEMEIEKSEPQKLETENQEKLVRKKREEIEQQLLDLPIVQYAWRMLTIWRRRWQRGRSMRR